MTEHRENPATQETMQMREPRRQIADEVEDRVDAWRDGLERRRRTEGLWTTNAQGEPEWLAPDDGPGEPVEPAGD